MEEDVLNKLLSGTKVNEATNRAQIKAHLSMFS